MHLKLTVAYDGTRFRGWARQPGERTVEGVLAEYRAQRRLCRLAGRLKELFDLDHRLRRIDINRCIIHRSGDRFAFHRDHGRAEVGRQRQRVRMHGPEWIPNGYGDCTRS